MNVSMSLFSLSILVLNCNLTNPNPPKKNNSKTGKRIIGLGLDEAIRIYPKDNATIAKDTRPIRTNIFSYFSIIVPALFQNLGVISF